MFFGPLLYYIFSPYLLEDVPPLPYVIGEHIVASSSKLIVIDKILSDILPKGERVLIFSVRLDVIGRFDGH